MGRKKKTKTEVEVVEREETTTYKDVVQKEVEVEIPVCDFCKQEQDEDTELVPVYFGDPARYLAYNRRKATVPHGNNKRINMIRGRTRGEIEALFKALNAMPEIEFELASGLMEPNIHDVEIGKGAIAALPGPATEINEDLAGATVTIRPSKSDPPEPDIEVCEYCKEKLQE